jgi:hypothetical protein
MPPDALRDRFRPLASGFIQPNAVSYAAARDVLNKTVFGAGDISVEDNIFTVFALALSGNALPGYATLDFAHVNAIFQILQKIKSYSEDASQKKPLNFLMLASPGAGKSHFIKCIAAKLGAQNIGAVTYNMVGLQRHEDLIPALDAARNFKVEDRVPLLFLDEFDVHEVNLPILLPLMWDGQITIGQHDLKLGKVVIVLAGSDPGLPAAMGHARSMRAELPQLTAHPKLIDLFSRINGGELTIPPLSDPIAANERRTDKICISVALLRNRFGLTLETVPRALLRFIAATEFRYGSRSIAHLVDLIPAARDIKELTIDQLKLPLESAADLKQSSLAYHLLCEDQAHGVATAWKEANAAPGRVKIWTSYADFLTNVSTEDIAFALDFVLDRLWRELQGAESSA